MPRVMVFRSGSKYATVEQGRTLAYICIEGTEEHITRRYETENVLACLTTLAKLTNRTWRWVR